MKEYENRKFKEYLRLIATIIKEGQDAGVFSKSLSPYVASRAIFGILNETMLQWVASKGKYRIEEISNTVMKIILDGIT
jgi:TetR/AcrR family fatty acid metabolism transcriptional regulator